MSKNNTNHKKLAKIRLSTTWANPDNCTTLRILITYDFRVKPRQDITSLKDPEF
jgi:hypothetical protein